MESIWRAWYDLIWRVLL